jgi:hypothetical protein
VSVSEPENPLKATSDIAIPLSVSEATLLLIEWLEGNTASRMENQKGDDQPMQEKTPQPLHSNVKSRNKPT